MSKAIDYETIATFDASVHKEQNLLPLATHDSHWLRETDRLDINRGDRERLVVYFKVDPKAASTASQKIRIRISYFDVGHGSLFIETLPQEANANNVSSLWQQSDRVSLNNTLELKSVDFEVSAADLTGRAHGADFRVTIVDPALESFSIYSVQLQSSTAKEHSKLSQFLKPSPNSPIQFNASEQPAVSIVIPVFNKLQYTLESLRCLCEFSLGDFEVIVVNNASTDQTQEMLSRISELRLINNDNNLGFAKACNQGAAIARGEYVVFLNNDTLVQLGWLGSLVNIAQKHENVGVVGSRLIYPHDDRIQSFGVSINRHLLPFEDHRGLSIDDPRVNTSKPALAVCAASMLIKKKLFDSLNGFDESYINGFEDIDLCLRAHQKGFQNWICAQSNVLHYQSATEGRFDLVNERHNAQLFRERWRENLSDLLEEDADQSCALQKIPLTLHTSHPDTQYQTGTKSIEGIECKKDRDAPGHCTYGPYVRLNIKATLLAQFKLSVSNIEKDDSNIVTIDIYDSMNDQVLAEKLVQASDVSGDTLHLPFDAEPNQLLEFRVFWHGACDIKVHSIQVNHV